MVLRPGCDRSTSRGSDHFFGCGPRCPSLPPRLDPTIAWIPTATGRGESVGRDGEHIDRLGDVHRELRRHGRPMDGMQAMVQNTLLGFADHVLDFAERVAAAGFRALVFHQFPRRALTGESTAGRMNSNCTSSLGSATGRRPRQSRGFETGSDPTEVELGTTGRDPAPPAARLDLQAGQLRPVTRSPLDAGASGVFVSNFGAATWTGCSPRWMSCPRWSPKLPAVCRSRSTAGFRRGTIVKALALGANAVGFGHPTAFSLAAGGEGAVRQTLDLLHGEITAVVGALGVSRPSELAPRPVRRLPV